MRTLRDAFRQPRFGSATARCVGRIALVAASAILVGCHQYRAVSIADPPPPGSAVRVEFAGAFPDPVTGATTHRLEALEGTLVSWDAQELRLAVRRAPAHPSLAAAGRPDTLAIAADRVASVDRREVRWRRVVVVGAIAAVVVPVVAKLAFDWARGSVDAGENGDPIPPP